MINTVLKYIIIFLIFFVLSLFQTSLSPYFGINGATLNFVFILFMIFIFFDTKGEGFFIALMAGFFLDVFSLSYFGISIVSLLAVLFFQKLANYFFKKSEIYPIFYFIIVFSMGFIIYNALLYLFSIIFHYEFVFGLNIIIGLVYNLIFAVAGFYIYRKFVGVKGNENQLKLF